MKKVIIIAVVILVIGAGVGYYIKKSAKSPYELATVQRGDIAQEVFASGKVEASTGIELHFKNSGKLISLKAKVGKEVKAGVLLAKQDTAVLDAQLAEMQAGIEVQKAKLDQLKAGASPEDIKVYATAVANAQDNLNKVNTNLANTEASSATILSNAYVTARLTMQGNIVAMSTTLTDIDNILGIDNDLANSAFKDYLGILKVNTKTNAINAYVLAKQSKLVTETQINNLTDSGDSAAVDAAITQTKAALNQVADALLKTKILLDNSLTGLGFPLSDLNTKKSIIDTDRTTLNNGLTALETNENGLNTIKLTNQTNIDLARTNVGSAEGALKTARDQLALKKAPPRSPDVVLYEAQIKQAKAQMQQVQAQIQDTEIIAPISGIITATNGNVGETIDPNTIVVSMISNGALQVKVNLSEDNVAGVQVGQPVRITADALSNEWQGTVTEVDPAGTVINGSVYYKTTITFNESNEQVKPGMTSDVWIKTGSATSTLVVPASAIQKNGSANFVQIYTNGKITDQNVTTGLKSQNGMIEIVSGLSGGEQVVTSGGK